MKPGGGGQKGSEFERTQAKLLSLWISAGADKDLLWRTGMSGGRHTIGALKNHGYGDLQVLKPTADSQRFMSLFCVELKHYANFDLQREWQNDKSNLRKWWGKVAEEAKSNNVQPLLVVKANRKDALIFFDLLAFQHIAPTNNELNHLIIAFDDNILIGFEQKEFLATMVFADFGIPRLLRKGNKP